MKNCPYCNGIVQDDSATFCGNCGMAWTVEQETGQQPLDQTFERPDAPETTTGPEAPTEPEVPEQPAVPDATAAQGAPEQQSVTPAAYPQDGQHPPPQYQEQTYQQQQQPQFYQQPDGQQMRTCMQCGRGIPVDYKVCPHCGKRTVQEPPPRPQPAPQPRPQYQRPMPPPRPVGPPPPRGRAGAGGMVGAIIGSIMIIIGSFILWSMSGTYIGVQDIDVNFGSDFVYAWLIPVFGGLVIILAPVAFAIQSKGAASAAMVFGLLAMLIAIVLPIHVATNAGLDIIDVFYSSNFGFTLIYLGGFMAIFGGISAMSGAASLGGAIGRNRPPRQHYPPQYQQGYGRY